VWDAIRAGRLARSQLARRAPAAQLIDVVRNICGIHAQVLGSAELQLAARVERITQADVRSALWEQRSLAKTWTIRGTLHIHPADELGLWTAARRAVTGEADYAADGLERVEEIAAAIGEALRGRQLLREELADAVAARPEPEPTPRGVSSVRLPLCRSASRFAQLRIVKRQNGLYSPRPR